MAWWSFIGDILKGGKEVTEVFKENEENKNQRSHNEKLAATDLKKSTIELDKASIMEYAAEFAARENRTWWDSFVDGLNRLPRPLLTIAVLSFFVLAPFDPARFFQIAKAYELMPEGYWTLLTVIIGFYFGGRMQLKSHDMTLKKNAVQAVKELKSMKEEFRKLEVEEESAEAKIYQQAVSSGVKVAKNSVIENWLKNR